MLHLFFSATSCMPTPSDNVWRFDLSTITQMPSKIEEIAQELAVENNAIQGFTDFHGTIVPDYRAMHELKEYMSHNKGRGSLDPKAFHVMVNFLVDENILSGPDGGSVTGKETETLSTYESLRDKGIHVNICTSSKGTEIMPAQEQAWIGKIQYKLPILPNALPDESAKEGREVLDNVIYSSQKGFALLKVAKDLRNCKKLFFFIDDHEGMTNNVANAFREYNQENPSMALPMILFHYKRPKSCSGPDCNGLSTAMLNLAKRMSRKRHSSPDSTSSSSGEESSPQTSTK